MRIYLDNCSLQRPLDDKSQLRIEMEADAIIEILSHCETGKLTLISSEILRIEIDDNTDSKRKTASVGILDIAREIVMIDAEIERRAEEFAQTGIKPSDALHLASAEAGKAGFFCTCDDRLLKKAKAFPELKVRAVSPIELLNEVEL